VQTVNLPQATTFTVPASVNAVGDRVDAVWTTRDAVELVLRVKDGPVLFSTRDPAVIASGTTPLHPGTNTTYVLEAWNAAGDKDTRSASVVLAAPPALTASPSKTTLGTPINLTWSLPSSGITDVVGIPSASPLKTSAATDWLELDGNVSAKQLLFAQTNDDIQPLSLPVPFRFPLFDGIREQFWISTNGFVAFDRVGSLLANADFSVAPEKPEMLAPLWDDLDVGNGQVLYVVDGETFPRRLVIQWNKVRTNSDPNGEMTFQVQLLESGEFRYLYKKLAGVDSRGEHATIGVNQGSGTFKAQLWFDNGSPVVANDDEYVWFTQGAVSGTLARDASRTTHYGFFARLASGDYLNLDAPVLVFGPNSILVNEAMPVPGLSAMAGRWVELYNDQPVDVDVSGLQLSSTGSTQPWVLPELMVPARGYVVLGESNDPNQNDQAPVDEVWTGLSLAASDTVQLVLDGEVLSSLSWTTTQAGQSIQQPQYVIDNTSPNGCARTRSYGFSSIGTPGARNETCFDYEKSPIPVDFEDLQFTGTPLFTPGANMDNLVKNVDLTKAPFNYFGLPYSTAVVSANGWLGFDTSVTFAATVNKTKPDKTTKPVGAVAPFWDDLKNKIQVPASNVYFEHRLASSGKPGRWIFQWENFTCSSSNPFDTLRFEAKLFDNGVIEFHYDTILSGTAANQASGKGATIWLERPTGDAAIAVGINESVMSANTAYRFTPKAPVAP
jgi:hypothetical protein